MDAFLIEMREERATPDALIARVASRQYGVVSLTQLMVAGVDRNAVTRRVKAGTLYRVHRGVYAVGHPALSREGRWLAAVLAYGAGAVLSHLSAGALWRIVSRPGEHIDVTVPRRGGRKTRRGIRLHRSITLPPSHRMLLNAIPVTRLARTLEDLRRVLPAKQFAAALREAEYLGLPVGERFARDGTRSELERLFLGLCVRHRLPPPAVNVRIGRYTADFVWDEPRLVVETDGWRAHRGRLAFEEDHVRDVHLTRRGYQVLRLTYRQVADDPRGVASMLRSLLAP